MKKYELTSELKTLADGTVLHRIRAVREFTLANGAIITPGTLGGWVEKEKNLSHENKAWVEDEAQVYGNAHVYGDAIVSETARVYGGAWVSGEARVYGNARVYGDAQVGGEADVCGEAVLRGEVEISNTTDYITAGPTGSRESFTTYCIAADLVFCGCFSGTLEQFAAAVEKTHATHPAPLAQYRAMVAYFTALRQNKNS